MEIDFYDEKIIVPCQKSLIKLKEVISKYYLMDMKDANELVIKYIGKNDTMYKILNEADYKIILNNKSKDEIMKIKIEVSENSQLFKSELNTLLDSEKKEKSSKSEPIHWLYSCKGCGKPHIEGPRYKCKICLDFNYCENCKVNLGKKHEHEMIKIPHPFEEKTIYYYEKKGYPENKTLSEEEKKYVHWRYSCKGCGMNPIVGGRYTCKICYDFNYCYNCLINLGKKHDHKMKKVELPLLLKPSEKM